MAALAAQSVWWLAAQPARAAPRRLHLRLHSLGARRKCMRAEDAAGVPDERLRGPCVAYIRRREVRRELEERAELEVVAAKYLPEHAVALDFVHHVL